MTFKPATGETQSSRITQLNATDRQQHIEIQRLESKNASEAASIHALRELDDRVRLKELKGHGGGEGSRIHPAFKGEHDLKIVDPSRSEEFNRKKVGDVPERSEQKKMRDEFVAKKLATGKPDVDACEVDKKGLVPKRNAEDNFEITTCGPDGKTPAMRKTFDYDAKTLIGITKWDKSGSRNYTYENGKMLTSEHVMPNRDSEIINYGGDGKTPTFSQKIDHNGKITMINYIDGKPQPEQTF